MHGVVDPNNCCPLFIELVQLLPAFYRRTQEVNASDNRDDGGVEASIAIIHGPHLRAQHEERHQCQTDDDPKRDGGAT